MISTWLYTGLIGEKLIDAAMHSQQFFAVLNVFMAIALINWHSASKVSVPESDYAFISNPFGCSYIPDIVLLSAELPTELTT